MFRDTREIYEAICTDVGKDPGSSANGHCPAHKDDTGSLSVTLTDDGKILLKCFAGCETTEVVRQLGFEMNQMFPSERKTPTAKRPHKKAFLTLQALAEYCQLPVEFLQKQGLREEEDEYYGRYVRIPSWNEEKKEYRITRMRLRIKADGNKNPKFKMRKGDKAPVYGEWYLPRIRELGYCVFVEGESDCWALWRHKYPALGMPGASQVKKLLKWKHLEGLKKIWVFCEPDKGGATFADAFIYRLKDLGYKGEVYRLYLNNYKDPLELHKAVGNDFRRFFDQALELKKPLEVTAASLQKTQQERGKALTDMGNGERLALQHGDNLRYCLEWKQWLYWDGQRWARDRIGEVKKKRNLLCAQFIRRQQELMITRSATP